MSKELEHLGFFSSSSDDVENPPTRGSQGNPCLKAGETIKLTSQVIFPQLWPHSQVGLVYLSQDKGYKELTIAEFSAGYASILQLPSISDTERNTRLDHFIGLIYLVTQFTWRAVHEFHTAVLFEIEYSHARWGDSFSDLETRLLRNSSRSIGTVIVSGRWCQSCFIRIFRIKNVGTRRITMAQFGTRPSSYSTFVRNDGQFPRVIAKHSEYSAYCPEKNVILGLASGQPSSVTPPS